MSDRKLGYLIIILLFLLSVSAICYFAWIAFSPKDIRTVVFEEVGSLTIQDPVCMNGVEVGMVRDMKHKDNKIHVQIESKDHFAIRTSSKIRLVVKGIMGDRYIEISSGDLNDPLIDKNRVLNGVFVMGPSEVLAYIDILKETITDIKDVIGLMRHGEEAQPSFVERFGEVVISLDSLSGSIMTVFTEIDRSITPGLDSAAVLLKKSAFFTSKLSQTVPQMISTVDSLIIKTGEIIPQVDTLLAKSQNIAAKLDSDNKLLWGNQLEDVQIKLESVKQSIHDLRSYGLDLYVKPKL
ncbi:MAG: MlaD family protein [Chitinispirillaceae bacterium]